MQDIGPYRVIRELGAGGMGRVFLAEGPEGQGAGTHRVAIKTLHPALLDRPDAAERFAREARIGMQVAHPHLVRTLEVGATSEGLPFLVMEYIPGRTLRALLDDLGRLPEGLCLHIAQALADALGAIHQAGVVHRDVKPDNVLLTPDNEVKLMDLGVAYLRGEALRLSRTGAFVGSVNYSAPEQFRGAALDGRCDLHGLGVTLYELASGEHPYPAPDLATAMARIQEGAAAPLRRWVPRISPFFDALVAHLMATDPAQRPTDAGAVVELLRLGESSPWWRRQERRAPQARRLPVDRATPVHGREPELTALSDAWRHADGPRACVISGEGGVGKTRLVDAFLGQADATCLLAGGYTPGGAATAWEPWRAALLDHVDGPDLTAFLRDVLGEMGAVAPALAAMVREDTLAPGRLDRDLLRQALCRVARSLAQRERLVWLVEDLHLAPPEGTALFAAMAKALSGTPALLIGTTRRTDADAWRSTLASEGLLVSLPLERLGARDLMELISDALGDPDLAETLGFAIARKSDGNPLFVFEMIRGLEEAGQLVRNASGGWSRTVDVISLEVPSTLRELLDARIAGLDAADQTLLGVCACQGHAFDPLLAGEVLGQAPLETLQRLATLETKGRFVRTQGRAYTFDHHLIQETLYAGMPPLLREQTHVALGRILATRPDRDDRSAWACARHFIRGRDRTAAQPHIAGALRHLRTRLDHRGLVDLVDGALSLAGIDTQPDHADLLLARADALHVLGDRRSEHEALDRAGATATREDRPALRGAVALRRAALAQQEGDLDAAENELRHALEVAGGDEGLMARITASLASVAAAQGRDAEAAHLWARAAARGAACGDLRVEVAAQGNLVIHHGRLLRYREALDMFPAFVARARALEDPMVMLRTRTNRAWLLVLAGHLGDALEETEHAFALVREGGYLRGEILVRATRAECLVLLGETASAREEVEAARRLERRLSEGTGSQGPVGARTEMVLARACLLDGDPAQARAHAQAALDAPRGSSGPREAIVPRLLLATLAVDDGQPQAAIAHLQRAHEDLSAYATSELAALVGARLAALGAADVGETRHQVHACDHALPSIELMEAHWILQEARGPGDPASQAHRGRACAHLERLVALAPEASRESMLRHVPLYRAVARALRGRTPVA